MSDVVEAGPPDAPRRGWVLGGLAVLLLGAVAYGGTRRGGSPAAPPASPAAATASPAAATARPLSGTARAAGRWLAPPLGEPTGLAVARAGRALRVLDVDTGRLVRTPLRGSGTVDPVAPIPGGWLVSHGEVCDTEAATCPAPRLYAVRGGEQRRVAPRAATALVAPGGRSVWLTYLPAPARDGDARPRLLEHRALDGRLLAPRTRLLPGEDVVGVTADGPVVAVTAPAPGGGPATGPVSVLTRGARRYALAGAAVVGAAGPRVAWLRCDSAGCALLLSDVTTGSTRDLTTLDGPRVRVAVDPAGRYVAIAPYQERPAREPVVVYDVASGRATPLGLRFPPEVEALAWSSDGWLLAAHGGGTGAASRGAELALWRPGLPGAVGGPRFPGEPGSRYAVAPRTVVAP